MLDPIKFPLPTKCTVCGKMPFYDILTRDTIARLVEGGCNAPMRAVVECCRLRVASWNLTDAIRYWNDNNR